MLARLIVTLLLALWPSVSFGQAASDGRERLRPTALDVAAGMPLCLQDPDGPSIHVSGSIAGAVLFRGEELIGQLGRWTEQERLALGGPTAFVEDDPVQPPMVLQVSDAGAIQDEAARQRLLDCLFAEIRR